MATCQRLLKGAGGTLSYHSEGKLIGQNPGAERPGADCPCFAGRRSKRAGARGDSTMRSILGVLIATTFLASVQGAQAPLQQAWPSSDIERFVPIGWVSTQSVLGDLNGDGVADAASVLLRNEAVNGNPVEQAGSRGLLVLFASPVGGYRFQDFAPEALPCASCLGDREGDPQAPVFELTIADGRLTVGWRRDAGVSTEVKLVIGYDPERGMLRLLGDSATIGCIYRHRCP